MELLKSQFHYVSFYCLMDYGASMENGTVFVIEITSKILIIQFNVLNFVGDVNL